MTPALALCGVERRFGARRAVAGVDLQLQRGELFCLLGPSGCGKTSLLRLIGGYLDADAGRIELAGRDVTRLPLDQRRIGMVFQSFALFPHLSARENIAFGLQARRLPRAVCRERADAMLARVGLDAATGDRLPARLSGGEQQRVALARALVIEPELLLLDEPMASLDRRLREAMRHELRALQQRTGVTTLLVTHDQEDALFLADRIGVMAEGRLLQVGTPESLYRRPLRPEVARFLGDANLLQVTAVGTDAVTLGAALTVAAADLPGARPGQTVLLRPEDLRLAAPNASGPANARVVSSTFLGADGQVVLHDAAGAALLLRSRRDALPALTAGEAVHVSAAPGTPWALAEPSTVDG